MVATEEEKQEVRSVQQTAELLAAPAPRHRHLQQLPLQAVASKLQQIY